MQKQKIGTNVSHIDWLNPTSTFQKNYWETTIKYKMIIKGASTTIR